MQEKLDHVAIVVLIIGTPVTQSMAAAHGTIPKDVLLVTALMGVAAACRPVLRVVGFVVGCIIWSTQHLELLTPSMLVQSALYIFGAASFLRSEVSKMPISDDKRRVKARQERKFPAPTASVN